MSPRRTLCTAAAVPLLASAAAAFALARDDATCGGNSALKQCGGGLPASFCCPAGSTCLPLNSTVAVSAICCPAGADCAFIQPVPCDVSLFNATLHPDGQIHIDNSSSVTLPTCGNQCCPLGYICSGDSCIATSATLPTSSSTAPSASQTASALPVSSKSSGSGYPAKAVVAGFFPGMIFGAILAALFLWAVRKRREANAPQHYAPGAPPSGHARNVSGPIYDPDSSNRTEFLRHRAGPVNNARPATSESAARFMPSANFFTHPNADITPGRRTPRLASLFSRSPKPPAGPRTPPPVSAHGTRPPLLDPYVTPPPPFTAQQPPQRQPSEKALGKRPAAATRNTSTETIDVLMKPAPSFLEPPGMRGPGPDKRWTQDTTFTQVMAGAGFGRDSREQVRGWRSPGDGLVAVKA